MKAVRKTLLEQPCRIHPLTDHDRSTFSDYSHLQRYFPAMEYFHAPEMNAKEAELPSEYWIEEWTQETRPKFWKAQRRSATTEPESCDVFTKIVHLLNPIDLIKEKYVCPEHPLLPQSEKAWKKTLHALHRHNNQAYVDAVANFVLSRFREQNMTPHCVLFYGAMTGISKSYQYNITPEYDSYRQCRWFWKGMESYHASLTVIKGDHSHPDIEEICRELITCPFQDEEDEMITIASLDGIEDALDTESVHSFTFDTIEEDADNANTIYELHQKVTGLSLGPCSSSSHSAHSISSPSSSRSSRSSNSSHSSCSSESYDSSNSSEEVDLDICLTIPNMPVIFINQEAQEGVMDDLLNDDTLNGHMRGSAEWEEHWTAWLFQVIAALTFLQKAICFTHNDLHSNNIVWRHTDQPFLYYKERDGTIWKVPTFGKIFSIIDFGRSIFRLGRRLWVSDDHWPDQDAGDQYNFGPFFDHTKTKHPPNPSFDLCRLAVSLMDGMFDDIPSKKKGKGVSIMSQEGSWKVYETTSPLYNLLWSWMVDDKGRTIYEDEEGNEKYEGFELYIRIAQDVHRAIPKDQLRRPIFQSFMTREHVDSDTKVDSLGI